MQSLYCSNYCQLGSEYIIYYYFAFLHHYIWALHIWVHEWWSLTSGRETDRQTYKLISICDRSHGPLAFSFNSPFDLCNLYMSLDLSHLVAIDWKTNIQTIVNLEINTLYITILPFFTITLELSIYEFMNAEVWHLAERQTARHRN